jgi:hypothetical protein
VINTGELIIGIFFVDNNISAFELVVVGVLASQSILWGGLTFVTTSMQCNFLPVGSIHLNDFALA